MAYIDPKTVDSPKSRIGKVEVRHNHGDWALAELEWDGERVLGIRWNGDEGESGVGSPQSRGHPTWFIVPEELAEAVEKQVTNLGKAGRDKVAEGYRAMARDREREREAEDWTEGLIGDGGDTEG